MLFGLGTWFPRSVRSREWRKRRVAPDAVTASTAAVVATTTAAGAGFAWLRLRADSVIAPVIAHAALNMVAFAGMRMTVEPRAV